MKKWTVMLIPHGGGDTRNLTLTTLHAWVALGLVLYLSMMASFWFYRNKSARRQLIEARQANHDLEEALEHPSSYGGVGAPSQGSYEEKIRGQYEDRDAHLASALRELYEIETEVRMVTGIPPRTEGAITPSEQAGGQGGPPTLDGHVNDSSEETSVGLIDEVMEGHVAPSADLLREEIRLRKGSLEDLLEDAEIRRERIARMPSIWPSANDDRWISSRFGSRKDPFTKRTRHHNGMDIVAPYKTEVVATAKGQVKFAGKMQYYGNLVKIDHGNGMETWYGHLNKVLVKKGDDLIRGDIVGLLGSTGRSNGPHIHYEIRIGNRIVDPKKYLGI